MMDKHISDFLPFDAQIFRISKALNKPIRAVKSEIHLSLDFASFYNQSGCGWNTPESSFVCCLPKIKIFLK